MFEDRTRDGEHEESSPVEISAMSGRLPNIEEVANHGHLIVLGNNPPFGYIFAWSIEVATASNIKN